MTSFVHPQFPAQHAGVSRAESVVAAAQQLGKGFNSTRGLASMLLAAMVAALVVVADQLVETWADGQLFVAWIVMWAVGFAAMALLAGSARNLSATVMKKLDGFVQRRAQARADERMWAYARTDARVMADIRAAASRVEDDSVVSTTARRVVEVERREAGRVARLTRSIWNE